VSLKRFETIGEDGDGAPRIYFPGTGSVYGDRKLMLTKNPIREGMLFQYGGVKGWIYGSTTNAQFAISDNTWSSTWSYGSNPVEHTLSNLRANKGDPCRLVGYTRSEVEIAVLGIGGVTAYAPDNRIWRMPSAQENYEYTLTQNGGWQTSPAKGYYFGSSPKEFLPAIGCREPGGSWIPNTTNGVGDEGYYWGSTRTYSGGPNPSDQTQSAHLWIRSNGLVTAGYVVHQAYAMSIRCVRNDPYVP